MIKFPDCTNWQDHQESDSEDNSERIENVVMGDECWKLCDSFYPHCYSDERSERSLSVEGYLGI